MKLTSVYDTRKRFFIALGSLVLLLVAALISGKAFFGTTIVTVNCIWLGRCGRPQCPYCGERFSMWGRKITLCPHCGKSFPEDDPDVPQ